TRSIYPSEGKRRTSSRAAGCAEFRSKDTVCNRPDADPARAYTVAPGRHDFASGGGTYSVVWWDPHVLHLDAPAPFGLRRDDLLLKDGDMFGVEERLMEYDRWRSGRERVVEAARRPRLQVRTATAWAAAAAADGIDHEIAGSAIITLEELPGAAGR